MGIQYRKRTKGKGGWFNFSYSDKNGFGMSTSVKVGGITHNFGGKRANRTTVDLGNGLKHVSYGPSKAKKQPTKARQSYTGDGSTTPTDLSTILQACTAAILAVVAMYGSFVWQIISAAILMVWIGTVIYHRHIKQK